MNKVTLKTAAPFVLLVLISLLALFVPSFANFDDGKYNGADIAWIIVATALVFLMTPGCVSLSWYWWYGWHADDRHIRYQNGQRRWR